MRSISVVKDGSSPVLLERFALAEHIAIVARGLGIETALIGASALAVHRYVRATKDIDLGSSVHPFQDLPRLEEALRVEGYGVRLTDPDGDDSLGGVLRVWTRVDEDDDPIEPVELVNFHNPLRPRRNPGAEAIATAVPLEEHPGLRCVQLALLIALKLDAGGRKDQADVVELLRQNPSADRDEIRDRCKKYKLDIIDQLVAEADASR
jgi:hypothetical protein